MNEPPPSAASGAALAPFPVREVALAPATPEHVEPIFGLIDAASRTTSVLPRSRESIRDRIDGFLLAKEAGELVACGALHPMGAGLMEIRSLVVAEPFRGQGVGAQIVLALVEEARRRGVNRIFTLTDAPGFFTRLGFSEADKATLPQKVWNDCVFCPKFNDCGETALDMWLTARPDPE